jgi:uncharacterized cupin superfamily protein
MIHGYEPKTNFIFNEQEFYISASGDITYHDEDGGGHKLEKDDLFYIAVSNAMKKRKFKDRQ